MDEGKGINPYFEGSLHGEKEEVVALRLALVKERDELRAALMTPTAEQLKEDVSDILMRALSGSDAELTMPGGYIRWGRFEAAIHAKIDARVPRPKPVRMSDLKGVSVEVLQMVEHLAYKGHLTIEDKKGGE